MATGAAGIAAVDVGPGVVVEAQGVGAGRDRDRIGPVGSGVGPEAEAARVDVDVDVRQRRRSVWSEDGAADLVAEGHRDVDRAYVGRAHRDRRTDALIGREVAGRVAQVAAGHVGPGVVIELQRVATVWRDSRGIGPAAVRVGPEADHARVGVDVDVRERRCSVGSEDGAADPYAEGHCDVVGAHVAARHRHRRAGVPIGREVAPGDVGVVAAVDVVAGVFVELERVAAVWRYRQRVVPVGVRVGPGAPRGPGVVDPDGPEGRAMVPVDGAADGHADRHPDVLAVHVGIFYMDQRAGVLLIGREVAPGDAGVVAAAEVMAGVVPEVQRVVAGRDREGVEPGVVRAGPEADVARVGVDPDALERRCSVGAVDMARDVHAEGHRHVVRAHVRAFHVHRRAGALIGREVAGGAAQVAAVGVG